MTNNTNKTEFISKDEIMLLASKEAGKWWIGEAIVQRFAECLIEQTIEFTKNKCIDVLKARYMQDNNREDLEVLRCMAALRDAFQQRS